MSTSSARLSDGPERLGLFKRGPDSSQSQISGRTVNTCKTLTLKIAFLADSASEIKDRAVRTCVSTAHPEHQQIHPAIDPAASPTASWGSHAVLQLQRQLEEMQPRLLGVETGIRKRDLKIEEICQSVQILSAQLS